MNLWNAVLVLAVLISSLLGRADAWAGQPPADVQRKEPETVLPPPKRVDSGPDATVSTEPPPELQPMQAEIQQIDLASALRLAGVQNPAILIARQRIVEALAVRQLAAAQILPSLNAGLNYDAHTGPVQQSNGNILRVERSALYLGAGVNAVAAGSVNIPGVVYNLNLSVALFNALQARQLVEQSRFASIAVQNENLRRVAIAYTELLRAEGRRSLAWQIRGQAQEVARLTANFAKTGQGSQADADRAATQLRRRDADLLDAEARVRTASARLAELLNLAPPVRLHPSEDRVVPASIVPDPLPLKELLAIALLNRPELREQQAAIRRAMLGLDSARLLPFSPNVLIGFSSGTFGGGSNIVAATGQPKFGNFGGRNDFDALMYWSLQNLGVGNLALIRAARSKLSQADLERLVILNLVRQQVATSYVQAQVRLTQIGINEEAAQAGARAFEEDLKRVIGGVGLPIALLESLQVSAQARYDYLDSIVAYNEAQFDLYVALGQPPADVLARPVPRESAAP